MFNGRFRSSFCSVSLALCFAFTAHAQVNVTTWHNDGARDGANTRETQLTPANVSGQGTFGELFSVPLDGAVYAQPLYVAGLTIGGGTHNVVFAATENDSVYAIDADTGSILWQRSFLSSGMTAVPSAQEDCGDIKPEIGITGTPVIDTATNTLYVVSATMPGPIQQLHAIDLLTGNDKLGGPVTISASVTGTGTGGNGTTVSFDPMTENQRSALLLTNGHIVIAWGSHCDHGNFHGWLMSYNAASLAQEAVLNTTPNGNDGGIWMSGAAPAVDAKGNIFFSSGNGDFGGPTITEFGDSTFKMPPPVAGKSWEPVDGFAPWNQASFSASNHDLGGGGVMLLPDLPTGATHQQLSIQSAKNGEIYVLDRNNMGGYCSSCTSLKHEYRSGHSMAVAQQHIGNSGVLEWNHLLRRPGQSTKGVFIQCRNRSCLFHSDAIGDLRFRIARAHAFHFVQRQQRRNCVGHRQRCHLGRGAAGVRCHEPE